jgi:hypothetical protein
MSPQPVAFPPPSSRATEGGRFGSCDKESLHSVLGPVDLPVKLIKEINQKEKIIFLV